MSSTTFSLRPCKFCGVTPRFSYFIMTRSGQGYVELRCIDHGVHALSEAVVATTWNAMNLPDERPRE